MGKCHMTRKSQGGATRNINGPNLLGTRPRRDGDTHRVLSALRFLNSTQQSGSIYSKY